ncbi:hypothetical protein ACFFQW_38415 [Umezawaea endophytica]|uniref:Uncharacterized protein n=1 Tax=Umezawaea endophytica TaxID=1654476 RepID=A0A9X2VY22_9PSEU|nr:hypothetical protein [Umezawaea endophytica]MCS7483818.1 hypothetical protein [Umezawaea endophytica]
MDLQEVDDRDSAFVTVARPDCSQQRHNAEAISWLSSTLPISSAICAELNHPLGVAAGSSGVRGGENRNGIAIAFLSGPLNGAIAAPRRGHFHR